MKTVTSQGFRIELPRERTSALVFASPHSGRDYPQAFLRASILDKHAIRSSEDAFVDQLLEAVTDYGAPLLAAHAPRAFIDLNRSADELDQALIRGITTATQNPRVNSGLGVIPRVVAGGRPIYRGKIDLEEAQARIAEYWRPYHQALMEQISETRALLGQAILIDCHSMPHEAIGGPESKRSTRRFTRIPEVVLGDRFGAACGGEIMELVENAFANAGFRVTRNTPFAGAYVTQAYGRPSQRQHAIQVEIDRALYMDEETIEPNESFEEVKAQLTQVIADIASIGRNESSAESLAAE